MLFGVGVRNFSRSTFQNLAGVVHDVGRGTAADPMLNVPAVMALQRTVLFDSLS